MGLCIGLPPAELKRDGIAVLPLSLWRAHELKQSIEREMSMSLELPEDVRDLVNNALEAGNPMLLAAITTDGKPRMSFRGSVQAMGADQLGMWARRAEGDTMEGIKANPNVALMYRDAGKRVLLQFTGRARIAADSAERDRVYESAPEREQRADPERKGDGIVIDIDRVEGMLGLNAEGKPNFLRMAREG
jgi:predicted pyridoxine 5'-phosphate oxidase superfamily flavin-nucleotide-binding protein